MSSTMTKFSDAVYHRRDSYDFAMTVFSRKELKVLLLIDGKKTISAISRLLETDAHSLMPQIVKLVKLGLIQTEGGIISSGATDLIFSEKNTLPMEYTITRLPVSASV